MKKYGLLQVLSKKLLLRDAIAHQRNVLIWAPKTHCSDDQVGPPNSTWRLGKRIQYVSRCFKYVSYFLWTKYNKIIDTCCVTPQISDCSTLLLSYPKQFFVANRIEAKGRESTHCGQNASQRLLHNGKPCCPNGNGHHLIICWSSSSQSKIVGLKTSPVDFIIFMYLHDLNTSIMECFLWMSFQMIAPLNTNNFE